MTLSTRITMKTSNLGIYYFLIIGLLTGCAIKYENVIEKEQYKYLIDKKYV